MTKPSASRMLLERLIATKGFAVRSRPQDDAYWYTSNKPGPFYINTENIAGEQTETMLSAITKVMQADLTHEERTRTICEIVMQEVRNDPGYRAAIDALVDDYRTSSSYQPTVISGGERRDWFFSIPVAAKMGLPHIYLFKSGEYFVTEAEGKPLELALEHQKVLHVADIINLASSYVTKWIPILRSTPAIFHETLSVAVRSQAGIDVLKQHQVNVISPLIVGKPLFAEALSLGLIPEFAHDEIHQYYDSPVEWTRSLLAGRDGAGDDDQHAGLDTRKAERIRHFRSTDPYGLKDNFPAYFA